MTTPPEPSRKAACRAARAWLRSTWPLSVGAYRPLAVGVREVAIAAGEGLHTPRAISDALRAHVASPKYVAALIRPGAVSCHALRRAGRAGVARSPSPCRRRSEGRMTQIRIAALVVVAFVCRVLRAAIG